MAINTEKPRKGLFEVRVGGVALVSTGPEPRPFPALKALDIEAIAEEAAAKAAEAAAAAAQQVD